MKRFSIPSALSRHRSKHGALSAAVVALAVAAVILFNLLAAQLPERWTQFDLTDSGIYNLSDVSTAYLEALDQDVVIHVLADESNLDSRITRFLAHYEEMSDHISVEYTDPVVYPSVLAEYDVDSNTIVVTSDASDRQESFSIDDIIGYDIMSYYYYGVYQETTFDADGLLTSAIDGVLNDVSRIVYQTTGHGETALSDSVQTLLGKSHLSVSSVNLLTDRGIPADCDLLLLNAPTRDLADDELSAILDYLASGGQVIYMMAGEDLTLPNLETLCGDYGIHVVSGLIADTARYYQNNPYWFFPLADTSSDAASGLSDDPTLLFCVSRGFTLTDPSQDSISVQSFLTTSESGLAITGDSSPENQTPGTYAVGAMATEEVSEGTTARLTVYGSNSLIDQTINDAFTNLDNLTLFLQEATLGFDDVSALAIEPVNLQTPSNSISTGGVWALLFIFVTPAGLLIAGLVQWIRRKKL